MVAVLAVAAMMAMMATIAGASGVAAVGGGGGMMAMIAGHQKDGILMGGRLRRVKFLLMMFILLHPYRPHPPSTQTITSHTVRHPIASSTRSCPFPPIWTLPKKPNPNPSMKGASSSGRINRTTS